jgi:DNA-binding MarR family transcriptional regulator
MNSKITLTTLETLVIAAFNTNYACAEDEKADNASWGKVSQLSAKTGLTVESVKGVLGSLVKKGLAFDYNEDHTFSLSDVGIDYHFEAIAERQAEIEEDALDQWEPLSEEESEAIIQAEIQMIRNRK